MRQFEIDGMAAIRATYGAPVRYTGAGLADEPVTAIRSDMMAAAYEGAEGRPGSISFEIDKSALPEQPRKKNTIIEASGKRWSVIDRGENTEVDAWVLYVEESAS